MLHCYWICWCIFLCLFTPSIDLYSSLVSKLSVLFRLSIIKMWKQRSATGRIQNLLLLSQFSRRKADACDLVVNVSWNYFSGQFPSGQIHPDKHAQTPPPLPGTIQPRAVPIRDNPTNNFPQQLLLRKFKIVREVAWVVIVMCSNCPGEIV